jgi:rhodanese-related sulfurtransferase
MTIDFLKNTIQSFVTKGSSILPYATIAIAVLGLALLTPLRHAPLITPTIDDIDPAIFYEKYKENPNQYIFIDVRGEDAFARVSAEGSANMPLHTLYDEWRNLPRNSSKTVVLICSGGRASGVGYHYLEHHGFYNIQRIENGIEGWQAAGLPITVNQL